MSAKRAIGSLVCGLALCSAGAAVAADTEEPEPELDFLEYLGMWDETDEEWLILDEVTLADNEERNDPASKDEESTERDDES